MTSKNHSGYLGFNSGIILIHAGWPIYPEEPSAYRALQWLTAFPVDTVFRCIDFIDECYLLLAEVKGTNQKEPLSPYNFHVALWHEDVAALGKKQLIEGVSLRTPRRWLSELPRDIYERLDTEGLIDHKEPSTKQWFEAGDEPWTLLHSSIRVTALGRKTILELLANATADLQLLGHRVNKLLDLCFYDAAVREACVALEHQIRYYVGSNRWGDDLVREFINRLKQDPSPVADAFRGGGPLLAGLNDDPIGQFVRAFVAGLRGEHEVVTSALLTIGAQIRTALKYIRNSFMHNLDDIDEAECRAILCRLARVKSAVIKLIAQ